MPRNPGTGVYTKPSPDVITGTTIESTVYNTFVGDVETDLNLPRPIVAGGTGANNATQARDNIDAEVAMQVVLNYSTHVFEAGSFYSAPGATDAPVAGHYFAGIAYGYGSDNLLIEARDLGDVTVSGSLYVRKRSGGVWGPWIYSQTVEGPLTVRPVDAGTWPSIYLDCDNGAKGSIIFGQLNGSTRWTLILGSTGARDCVITRYNDSGSPVDNPFIISRSTGRITIKAENPVFSWEIAPKQYVDDKETAINASMATKVAKAGDTMTGNLIVVKTAAPSLSMYDTTAGNPFGMWLSGNQLNFGTTDSGGAGTPVAMRAYINTLGQLAVTSKGFQPGGGTWGDSSDARIKNIVGDYQNGLDAVLTLRPVVYTFKGNDTPADQPPSNRAVPGPDETSEAVVVPYANSPHYNPAATAKEFIGLVAQECEAAFPEMVAKHPGTIDGQPVTDLRALDTTPLIFALVNACKELAARIEALEAAQTAP